MFGLNTFISLFLMAISISQLNLSLVATQTCGVPKTFDQIQLQNQIPQPVAPPRRLPSHDVPRKIPPELHHSDGNTSKQVHVDKSALVHHRHDPVIRPWESNSTSTKIVGGYDLNDATGGNICWQVGIRYFREDFISCGGSIVGSQTVLTAAHCLFYSNNTVLYPWTIGVLVGALDGGFDGSNSEGVPYCGRRYNVSSITMHPQFMRGLSHNYDIAILTLSEKIDFSGTCACPICLINKSPAVGEWTAVSGYGLEEEGGEIRPNGIPIPLRFLYLQVLQNTDDYCYIVDGTDLNQFICAGDVEGQDSCNGDSGGPLFAWDNDKSHGYYLAGTVAYGHGCARGYGGQYIKVQYFLPWIMENAKEPLSIQY